MTEAKSEGQTLADAGKPNVDKNAPGASDQTKQAGETAPLYRVVAPRGFFSDRLYRCGEVVRFGGKPSKGVLELVDEKQEAAKPRRRKSTKQAEKGTSEEVL